MDETEGQVVSDPVAHYVAGALAGSANIVTGYPFDTGTDGNFLIHRICMDMQCLSTGVSELKIVLLQFVQSVFAFS